MKDEKAIIWDKRNRGAGEPYKRHVTDPIILELSRPLQGKTVLEQGCGNGHLARKIAREKPAALVLLDMYEGNLSCARRNLSSVECKLEFVQADLNKPLGLGPSSMDVVTSSMVLCEVKDLDIVVRETYRVLKNNGVYVIATVHPSFSLLKYLHEKLTGKESTKIIPPRSYFDRSRSDFILGVETHEEIRAPYYHRTIQDYTDTLLSAGFSIEKIIEPNLTPGLLKEAPRFAEATDAPISLVIKAKKVQK